MTETTTRPLPLRLHPRPVRTFFSRLSDAGGGPTLADDRYFIGVCVFFLFLAVLTVWLSRGMYLGWDGLHEIPTEPPPSCGDYCGTDAGLITEPAS